MQFKEFAGKFPNLAKCLVLIAEDGDFFLEPTLAQDHFPKNLEELEAEASLLKTDEEFMTFSAGEDSEKVAIRDRLGIQKLDDFLNEAFDGKYTEVFYG